MRVFSIKVLLILVAMLFSFSSFAEQTVTRAPAPEFFWMKLKAKDKYERSAIADLGITVETVVEDNVYTFGDRELLEVAKKSGYLVQSFSLGKSLLGFPGYDSNFHDYAELTSALSTLQAEHPNLIRLSSLGTSIEGRQIPLITVSVDQNDQGRPAVFFLGGHHAREHVSVETPLNLAKYLAREYAAGNERIVNLLNTRTIYIAPLINPDGAEFDIRTGDYKLWRKNRRLNGGNIFGVDLNRNYGYGWGGGGASTDPRNDTFRGQTAFSEPETRAVKNFIETHKNITIALTFHTFSELILYPWGHKYESIEDQKAFAVHKTMAEKMAKWNGYTPQQSSELYIASGDTTDWAYGQLGVISFTFELDPKMSGDKQFDPGKGFYPGQGILDTVFRKNLEPCLYLVEYADNPYRAVQSSSEYYGFKTPILQ